MHKYILHGALQGSFLYYGFVTVGTLFWSADFWFTEVACDAVDQSCTFYDHMSANMTWWLRLAPFELYLPLFTVLGGITGLITAKVRIGLFRLFVFNMLGTLSLLAAFHLFLYYHFAF